MLFRSLQLTVLALLLSSCEAGAEEERLAYVSGNRRVEILVADFGGGDFVLREDILFVRVAEAVRLGSSQGLMIAVAMAETRAAGLAAQWVTKRSKPDGADANSTSTAITLTGGTTLLQQVKEGRVDVVRAYPVPTRSPKPAAPDR